MGKKILKSLDVRPQDEHDYIGIFGWMFSKRLVWMLSAALIVVGICLILLVRPIPFAVSDWKDSFIMTYRYRSLPLKFYKGRVRILAEDGHVAYIGEVSGGAANGMGKLYNKQGALVYEGEFQDNKYQGMGELFNGNGTSSYQGEFTENLPNGHGVGYREDGSKEYEGAYVDGERTGEGQLFNAQGDLVYEGEFLDGKIGFEKYVGKPTGDLEQQYFGDRILYTMGDEFAAWLSDLGVVYAASQTDGAVEEEWRIEEIVVLSGTFSVNGEETSELARVAEYFGEARYEGNSRLLFYEAVCLELLGEEISIEKEVRFDTVYEVFDYGENNLVLVAFEKEGLLYTFYSKKGSGEFLMYAVSEA